MINKGREWELLTARATSTSIAAQRATGKLGITLDALRTHVGELRTLLSEWELAERDIANFKESDQ